MQQRHELEAWLGPALEELTPEQVDRLHQWTKNIAAYYPGEGDEHLREAALSAAVQYLLGDITPEQAAAELAAARLVQARASAAAQQIAAMMVWDGAPKARAARQCGIDRMTLLTRLGER